MSRRVIHALGVNLIFIASSLPVTQLYIQMQVVANTKLLNRAAIFT